MLVLLDISAAFDTTCHNILLYMLRVWLGISGVVFGWIKSCLTDRFKFAWEKSNPSQHQFNRVSNRVSHRGQHLDPFCSAYICCLLVTLLESMVWGSIAMLMIRRSMSAHTLILILHLHFYYLSGRNNGVDA